MAHRPVCKYDGNCYRKNDDHLKGFAHPKQDEAAAAKKRQQQQSPGRVKSPAGRPAPAVTAPSPQKLAPAKTGSSTSCSPAKRQRDESTGAAFAVRDVIESLTAKPPAPRPSPLGMSTSSSLSLFDVYEMPYPQSELETILNVAKSVKPGDPLTAFEGWRLVGPFEVLLGKSFSSDSDKWRHFRFRYDPPEVQTVAISTAVSEDLSLPERHVAYHRDDPINYPGMVVMGTSRGNKFSIEGDSVAGFLLRSIPEGPALLALRSAFPLAAKQFRDKNTVQALRRKQQTAATLHGLGILVPYDKKTEVGYREMMLSLAQLKNIVAAWNSGALTPKSHEDIEEQFRFADIANDECDFGLNVELGLNLLALVEKKNDVLYHAHRILDMAYMLLGRGLYQHILLCHLPTLAGGPVLMAKTVSAATTTT